jgi:hypothetical protein
MLDIEVFPCMPFVTYSTDAFLPLFVPCNVFGVLAFFYITLVFVFLMTVDGKGWCFTILDKYKIVAGKNEHSLGILVSFCDT